MRKGTYRTTSLHFYDGRIYLQEVVFVDGQRSLPRNIDVTKEVAEAIQQELKSAEV